MARLTGVDVTVFSVGGASVLEDLRGATVKAETQFADVTPLILAGKSNRAVKQSVAIEGALTSTKTGGQKVTHLDVSLLQVAGFDYRSVTEKCRFEGRITHEDGSGIGDEWAVPVAVQKDYKAQVELSVDPSAGAGLVSTALGSLAGKPIGFAVTINGVTVAVPMALAKFEHRIQPGSRQIWVVDLTGSALVGFSYPTSPTGSGTLLEHCFNSPGIALPIAVLAGSGQPQVSGDFLVSRFGFQVTNAGAVESAYSFASTGEVALS
ncbi:MAG: hypothetical protein JSS71_06740 [Armatimonadetes bacterium]|nr:hypothetical protein [Armatimonadota bacterium]MBX3107671.1 hypothetical protein [Fimbriimonadaceae bacterium]